MNNENVYDERYDNSYEETEKNRSPWLRIVFIILGIIVLVVLILLLLKACGNKNKDLSRDLLEAGKEHYRKDETLLPVSAGECKNVTLDVLLSENLITTPEDYEVCDKIGTYVKVCKLESENYHYVPILSCGDQSNEFGPWTIGDEKDITPDKSDVRFLFLGEQAKGGVKYYYPGNEKDPSKINEYYVTSPSEGYDQKDNAVTNAYKWYTEKTSSQSVYWNNGEYSSTQPAGYSYKGNKKTTEAKTSDTKPASAEYRTITESTLYRTKTEARPYKYRCIDEKISGDYYSSGVPCEAREEDTFKHTVEIFYTCDGINSTSKGTVCTDWSNWSTNKCEENILKGTKCETKTTYSYVDTMWQWYKKENVTTKSYYPSGSSNKDEENTYYVTQPVDGSIKDSSTQATAYKFYKVVEETGNNENQSNQIWVSVNKEYVSIEELISNFQSLEYNVNSLKDIIDNKDIRYQIQLQYRDVR